VALDREPQVRLHVNIFFAGRFSNRYIALMLLELVVQNLLHSWDQSTVPPSLACL
jgi:hypothetical protein